MNFSLLESFESSKYTFKVIRIRDFCTRDARDDIAQVCAWSLDKGRGGGGGKGWIDRAAYVSKLSTHFPLAEVATRFIGPSGARTLWLIKITRALGKYKAFYERQYRVQYCFCAISMEKPDKMLRNAVVDIASFGVREEAFGIITVSFSWVRIRSDFPWLLLKKSSQVFGKWRFVEWKSALN